MSAFLIRGVVIASLGLAFPGTLAAQAVRVEPKAELLAQAAAETKKLGDQVVRGNYSFTIQRMYPRWKAQAAKRIGGMDKLVEALAKVPDEMQRNGITILSFEVGRPESIFEVTQVVGKNAAGVEFRAFTEWLVFVPTTTKYLVIEKSDAAGAGNPGRKRRLMTTGYQVAVRNKESRDWTFIDGSSLTVESLRRMFPSLPATKEALKLPPVGGLKEIK